MTTKKTIQEIQSGKAKVAVIGGGVIGLATAWCCARRGLDVTLFEKDSVIARQGATGCSPYSLGSLVPYTPTRQHDTANFQRASLKQYSAFLEELYEDSGQRVHYQQGRIQLLTTEGKLESAQLDLNIKPDQGFILTPEDIAARYPYLTPSDHGAFFCHDSAYLEPVELLDALYQACLKRNVQFKLNQKVNIKELKQNFNHIVVAAGAGSQEVLGADCAPETAVEELYGHGIELKLSEGCALPERLPLIRQNEVYLCRHGDRVLLGSDTTRASHAAETLPEKHAIQEILETAYTMMPELKKSAIQKVWRAPRPKAKHRAAPIREISHNVTLLTGHYKIGFCVTPKVAVDVAERLKEAYM